MKKFKCLLAAVLLACSTASFAQFTNGGGGGVSSDVEAWKGLRFSYDRTFMSAGDESWYGKYGMDISGLNGFSVGYVQSWKIAKSFPVFFETGANVNFARWSDSDDYMDIGEDLDLKGTSLGLSIPLNIVLGAKINDNLAIKPYTGFYLRVNLMAKAKMSSDEDAIQEALEEYELDSYNLFDEDDMVKEDTWKRIPFGWQIGATLDINRFNVGIGYAIDFNEIADDARFGIFSARLGYNF